MTPVSARHGLPLLVLLLTLGAFVLAADRVQRVDERCANPAILSDLSRVPGVEPRGRIQDKIEGSVIEWSEGRIPGTPTLGGAIQLRLIRSTRSATIYERPVRFIGRKLAPDNHRVIEVATRYGAIPVHVLRDRSSSPSTIVAYAMVYGVTPVENGFTAHLARLFDTIQHGASPMTLLIADSLVPRRSTEGAEERIVESVKGAYERFAMACTP